jgi:hypothetical protein
VRDQFADTAREETAAAVSTFAEELAHMGDCHQLPLLLKAARLVVEGQDAHPAIMTWMRAHFPAAEQRPNGNRNPEAPRKPVPKKQLRRREYARIQTLWKADRKRVAQEILEGGQAQVTHTLEEISAHWQPVCEGASHPCPRQCGGFSPTILEAHKMWEPITMEEVDAARLRRAQTESHLDN